MIRLLRMDMNNMPI